MTDERGFELRWMHPRFILSDFSRDVAVAQRGCVRIATESNSIYLLDFDSLYLRRIRGTVPSEDPEVLPASHLRRDGEVLKVLRVLVLRIGRRAIFDIQPLGNPAFVSFTRRTTTYVVSIETWGGDVHD